MRKQTPGLKAITLFLATIILLTSCASTTLITSEPSGAKVYLDDQIAGQTPLYYTDTKIVGSITTVSLVKDGYYQLNTSFSRDEQADVGAIIGGLFLWVPFLWTMKYKPVHAYELEPMSYIEEDYTNYQTQENTMSSKASRLRELKALLDEKIITQEEFEKEKTKILNEDNK